MLYLYPESRHSNKPARQTTSLQGKFAAAAPPAGLAAPLVDAPLAVRALGVGGPAAQEDCDNGGGGDDDDGVDRPPPRHPQEAVKKKESH